MSAPTTSHAVATALRLAVAQPEAMLPCPVCAAGLRAANLESHLRKVHAGIGGGVSVGALTFRGKDRAFGRELLVVLVVALVLSAVPMAANGGELSTTMVTAIGVPVLAIFTLVLLAVTGVFRARLVIDGDRVRLRYGLGLRSRSLLIGRQVELGRLWTLRPRAGMSTYENTRDAKVEAGAYLRLLEGKRRITVGCPKGTGTRKHWSDAGWKSGASTRYWDITLDRETMVALEYALADRGVLSPRAGS